MIVLAVQTNVPRRSNVRDMAHSSQHKEITMSESSLHPQSHAVNRGRFVAATPEGQAEFERQVGRNLYRRGRQLDECVTDDMTAGWLAAERAGADAYYRCMMAQASNSEVM